MKNRMAGRWRAAAVVLLFGAFSAGAAGTPSYSNQLLQLASSNIFDRLSAARALGGNPEAAGALIQAAKDP